MNFHTAALHPLLNAAMWVYAVLLVIAFFLWATGQIEKWVGEDADERRRP